MPEPFGVAASPMGDDLIAVAAPPHDGLCEGFEDDSVTTFAFQTKQQIDRALE